MLHPSGHHFVEGRYRMSGTDLAGVLRIVVEIFRGQNAILVADQPIGGDAAGLNST